MDFDSVRSSVIGISLSSPIYICIPSSTGFGATTDGMRSQLRFSKLQYDA